MQIYLSNFRKLAIHLLAKSWSVIKSEHSYLSVILSQQMSFTSHINHIVAKASKVLNFLKQNLRNCSTSKSTAYVSLV